MESEVTTQAGMSAVPWAFLGLVMCCACHDPASVPEILPEEPITSADELFSLGHVAEFRFTLSGANRQRLFDEPRLYVPATMRFLGKDYEDVGFRLKGTYSFQDLNGKSAFKIKFNEYVKGRRILGLRGVTLNNMNQDHTTMREHLTYSVFRASAAHASRTGFAKVFVDGEYYGLYSLIESIDKTFLADNFSDFSGSLFEGDFGDDLREADLWEFDQDGGEDDSRAALAALIEAVKVPGDGIFFGDNALIDTRSFLSFVAAEAMTGHWDGYWKSHNYRIYHEPTLDKWYFIPWGADQSLRRDILPFDGAGLLTQKCFSEPTCYAEYVVVAAEVMEIAASLMLPSVAQEAAALIAPVLALTSRDRFLPGEVVRHRAIQQDYLSIRPALMSSRLDCMLDGLEVDRDNDGYGACQADCNDDSDLAFPGGTEVCDGLDNDCDGYIDELSECPCTLLEVGGTEFRLCADALRANLARAKCQDMGGELAWVVDEEENQAIYAKTQELAAGWWFLGLGDSDEEGTFVWEGGYSGNFRSWAVGEPDSWGLENCVGFADHGGGDWGDHDCANAHAFVCRILGE